MADVNSVSVDGGMGMGRMACRMPVDDRWGITRRYVLVRRVESTFCATIICGPVKRV